MSETPRPSDWDELDEQIGWRIRHDLLPQKVGERQPAFMYGKSVNEAIDAAMTDAGRGE